MTDGNTSSSGALDYAVHPLDADGKNQHWFYRWVELCK
jgi:hypothetical protein